MTEKNGFDPRTGAWNDSQTGDYLWSRNNFGEARPDVMSPFTYSMTEKVWSKVSFLPGYRLPLALGEPIFDGALDGGKQVFIAFRMSGIHDPGFLFQVLQDFDHPVGGLIH